MPCREGPRESEPHDSNSVDPRYDETGARTPSHNGRQQSGTAGGSRRIGVLRERRPRKGPLAPLHKPRAADFGNRVPSQISRIARRRTSENRKTSRRTSRAIARMREQIPPLCARAHYRSVEPHANPEAPLSSVALLFWRDGARGLRGGSVPVAKCVELRADVFEEDNGSFRQVIGQATVKVQL